MSFSPPFLNVRDFGALGSGTQDEFPAFKAARLTASSPGLALDPSDQEIVALLVGDPGEDQTRTGARADAAAEGLCAAASRPPTPMKTDPGPPM
jgi:hypothetical protein